MKIEITPLAAVDLLIFTLEPSLAEARKELREASNPTSVKLLNTRIADLENLIGIIYSELVTLDNEMKQNNELLSIPS
jgi:hypothetical protein